MPPRWDCWGRGTAPFVPRSPAARRPSRPGGPGLAARTWCETACRAPTVSFVRDYLCPWGAARTLRLSATSGELDRECSESRRQVAAGFSLRDSVAMPAFCSAPAFTTVHSVADQSWKHELPCPCGVYCEGRGPRPWERHSLQAPTSHALRGFGSGAQREPSAGSRRLLPACSGRTARRAPRNLDPQCALDSGSIVGARHAVPLRCPWRGMSYVRGGGAA